MCLTTKNTLAVPIVKEGEIAIVTVCNDHRMRRDGDAECTPVVSASAVGNIHELRKKAVIIKRRVHLRCTFFVV